MDWRIKIGIPPVDPYIERVNLDLELDLNNPTGYEMRIRDLNYEVRLNGRSIAKGHLEEARIRPGGSTVRALVSIDAGEAASAVFDAVVEALRKGKLGVVFHYEISGSGRVPVTVLGIEVPGMEVPLFFTKVGTYEISLNPPIAAQPPPPTEPV